MPGLRSRGPFQPEGFPLRGEEGTKSIPVEIEAVIVPPRGSCVHAKEDLVWPGKQVERRGLSTRRY